MLIKENNFLEQIQAFKGFSRVTIELSVETKIALVPESAENVANLINC